VYDVRRFWHSFEQCTRRFANDGGNENGPEHVGHVFVTQAAPMLTT